MLFFNYIVRYNLEEIACIAGTESCWPAFRSATEMASESNAAPCRCPAAPWSGRAGRGGADKNDAMAGASPALQVQLWIAGLLPSAMRARRSMAANPVATAERQRRNAAQTPLAGPRYSAAPAALHAAHRPCTDLGPAPAQYPVRQLAASSHCR